MHPSRLERTGTASRRRPLQSAFSPTIHTYTYTHIPPHTERKTDNRHENHRSNGFLQGMPHLRRSRARRRPRPRSRLPLCRNHLPSRLRRRRRPGTVTASRRRRTRRDSPRPRPPDASDHGLLHRPPRRHRRHRHGVGLRIAPPAGA